RYRAAEQEARGALSHDPRDVASWIVLSRALIGQDRDADGESAAQEAVRVNPLEPHGHFLVGFARQRMSDPWGSVPPMREAVRLAGGWARFPARLAIALGETGERDEARRLAQQAIALRPDDPYPHSNGALTYNVLGEYSTAEAYIRRAITLAPSE